MRLEQSLVLNRYFHSLFGARDFEDLKPTLRHIEEGAGRDGQSRFFHALAVLKGLRLADEKFREYDAQVMDYEARLAKARGSFTFKYFQYLGLLYAEIFFDCLTEDPGGFVQKLNVFLEGLKQEEVSLREFPPLTMDDLRRLAFFMATGSGKTLLLHTNLWQILHYLNHGKHPEALVNRADHRREFDNILVITPREELSQQHLEEFRRSGIDAALLIQDRTGPGLFGPRLKVIEIQKLTEEPSGEGVSISLDELGDTNLVFVDEGHKGTGSEAQTWKNRQKSLSVNGFLLEYSATFAQSIGAASTRIQKALLTEYGKTILFDYSYRHFYNDGHGKDFRVLNLVRGREVQAHELLLGGFLIYYQQVWLFQQHERDYFPYNLEKPLWVFLGSSVNAVYSQERQQRSDVAVVVGFLRRFLEDSAWAASTIAKILQGESGFIDEDTREDLFARHLTHFRSMDADDLYQQMTADVFHGRGGLEVRNLKSLEGELGLRVSVPDGKENPYFGVISIGDVPNFKKHLLENLGIDVREDRFASSLFAEVNAPNSRVNILIGAKKFIEGWSSWRVSAMGLLNIGKGEGPQVIQLFGRGVRLRGKKESLKRSTALPEERPHPEGLSELETLFIFGWNADYIQTFRSMLEREELGHEIRIPVQRSFEFWPDLPIPKPREGYAVVSETWTLAVEPLHVSVDLTPQVTAFGGEGMGAGTVGKRRWMDFSDPAIAGLLDIDGLYTDLIAYKQRQGCGNLYVPRDQILSVLRNSSLFMSVDDLSDSQLVQEGALRILKTYLDRFVARKEREAEGRHLEPSLLPAAHESIVSYYTVRVSSEQLLRELEALLCKPTDLYRDGDKPLPRLYVDKHLFNPILLHPEDHGVKDLSVSPPGLRAGEARFVKDLREFWKENHGAEPYRNLEIFLLRNLPRVGVGFFHRSGFYPDFILWIKDRSAEMTRVRFMEPHGLHHGGLAGNEDKIEALKELKLLSDEPAFRAKKITLDGYILTTTELHEISDAKGQSWETLEREYRVLYQEGAYIHKIVKAD